MNIFYKILRIYGYKFLKEEKLTYFLENKKIQQKFVLLKLRNNIR